MHNDSVLKLFNNLPENLQREVIHFIEFLASRAGIHNKKPRKKIMFLFLDMQKVKFAFLLILMIP